MLMALIGGCVAAGRGKTLSASTHVDCLIGCWCHDHFDCGILNFFRVPLVIEVVPIENINNNPTVHTECHIDCHCRLIFYLSLRLISLI